MSTTIRAAARPIRIALRSYSTGSQEPILQTQDGEALKIYEDIAALVLDKPKQVFDNDIISRETIGGEDDEGLTDLPISPIMDTRSWKRRFKQERKENNVHITKMTERERQLVMNPYANALATSTRLEGFFSRSLPSFFLQRMKVFVHPETKDPWIIPVGIRHTDTEKIVPGAAKYIGLNNSVFEALKSKKWKKLQDSKFVTSAVWRTDMANFVLGQLKDRVYHQVVRSRYRIRRADGGNRNWEDLRIGCILVWGSPKSTSGDTKTDSHDAKANALSTDGISEGYLPQRTESARSLIRVKGKLVPRYNMQILLGPEKTSELRDELQIPNDVNQSVILISTFTRETQMWLWKLSGYVRQPKDSLFREANGKI
ncbi:hypothetical protein ABW19_dt0206272 [Dactylella cylindrospora]|nr:hypothetical protein ABW19_dt0206272 [Dactylella cylindrospora]